MIPSRHPDAPQVHLEPGGVRIQELQWEAEDADVLATARACFEAREFLRAVHLLRERKSAKARFLSLYSQFLVCLNFLVSSRFCHNNSTRKASEKKALRDWHKLDSKPLLLNK